MSRDSYWSSAGVKWLVSVLTVVLLGYMVYGLAAAIMCKGISSSEAAGWTQAIGALLAIGAAIFVSHLQAERQEKHAAARDAADVVGMLDCILCELELVKQNANLTIDPAIRTTRKGDPVQAHYPVSESPFRIYESFIPKLGMITSKPLRLKITEAYTCASSFVYTIRYNNELFRRWEVEYQLFESNGSETHKKGADHAMADLRAYGDGVRDGYFLAIEKIDAAILALTDFQQNN